MAFAPVCDIAYNWENTEIISRAFGNDPERVAKMSAAYLKGAHTIPGFACAAKHFPGNGQDFRDAHLSNNVNYFTVEEWEQKGTHEKHLSLLDFEKQERAKEVAALEAQKTELEEHNATMQEVNEKWLDHLENIEKEIFLAQENREEAGKQAEQAKKKASQYEKKLTEIAPMVKDMERFAEKYSADPEEVLPEAGTLEMEKSYREKKAKPLIKKIVAVLRSVYRDYLDLSRRFSDMQKSYERAWSKVNSLTARVEELWNENRNLRERLVDFGRVERALGRDTVETIVQKEKRLEEVQRMQKQRHKRKIDRGER